MIVDIIQLSDITLVVAFIYLPPPTPHPLMDLFTNKKSAGSADFFNIQEMHTRRIDVPVKKSIGRFEAITFLLFFRVRVYKGHKKKLQVQHISYVPMCPKVQVCCKGPG